MKYAVISGLLCAALGFFVGTQVDSSDDHAQRDDSKVLNNRNEQSPSSRTRKGQSFEDARGSNHFTDVVEKRHVGISQALASGDSEKAVRLIRESIELEFHFGTRISSVCRTLSLMNEDNAAIIKAAFDQSWEAGFDYYWERELFVSRYSEFVGFQAVEEYPQEKFRRRAIGGWARTNTDEAIDWVNQLPEGQEKNRSISAVMWNVSRDDPGYALEVFRSFPPDEQMTSIGDLMQLTRRRGGAPACANLAEKLRTSDSQEDRNLARGAYHTTFNAYQQGPPEIMNEWLDQLPTEALGMIQPHLLPEKYLKKLSAD